MVRFQKRRRPGTCLGQPEPGATHMVPQHLVYKAAQLLRRALDLAQEPVLHNTYQRAHIELGQHGELLLPSLIPQLRGNQTDRALDNSTDIRLEEPLQVVPTHRAKGAEAERTILLQVLEKLEDELGVMTVARPPEVREYGFLPAGVYDKDHFALRLMDKPASYFYSVLWNKLYRRILLTGNDICFTSEVRWAEDLVFNMQYIQYAEVFVAIGTPGYYYVQNPQSICHTQINPATIVQNKLQMFRYYKDLYTRLGMYEEVRPQLYKFLVDIAESTYPSGPFKKAIDEAKAYWRAHKQ